MEPEYALESYTVERIRDEIAAMNTTLLALDDEAIRTLAYNCCDTTAGGQSYVDAVRPLFLAARAGEDRIAADVIALDPMLVPSWAARSDWRPVIAFAQEALDAGGLAVFQFTASAASGSPSPARPTGSCWPGSPRTERRSGPTRSSA